MAESSLANKSPQCGNGLGVLGGQALLIRFPPALSGNAEAFVDKRKYSRQMSDTVDMFDEPTMATEKNHLLKFLLNARIYRQMSEFLL